VLAKTGDIAAVNSIYPANGVKPTIGPARPKNRIIDQYFRSIRIGRYLAWRPSNASLF